MDPFAARPTSGRASGAAIQAAQLRLQAAQENARKNGATTSERATVISAQSRLDATVPRWPDRSGPAEALARIRGQVGDQGTRLHDFRKLKMEACPGDPLTP